MTENMDDICGNFVSLCCRVKSDLDFFTYIHRY